MNRSKYIAIGWAAIPISFFSLLLLLYICLAFAEATPLQLPYQAPVRSTIRIFFTQGWGFFTKDPRKEEFLILQKKNGHWQSYFKGPNANPENYFGLSRYPRSQGLEFGLLAQTITEKEWQPCEAPLGFCLDQMSNIKKIRNPSQTPVICGPLGFVFQKPVPWAWNRFNKRIDMPSRIIKVDIQCKV